MLKRIDHMLRCKDISLQSSNYLENDMSAWQRLKFALHLLICGHCRRFVQHLRKAITAFKQMQLTELDQDTADRLGENIATQARRT